MSARTLVDVQQHRSAAHPNTTYRVYDDGHVVAYGPELAGPRPGLWIASVWRGHPLDDEDATHIEHLAADSTWRELETNIKSWEEGQWPN